MRLVRLVANGIRAFSGTVDIPLDADTIIVNAANGQGKTSLLDTIMFGLCGAVPRLGDVQSVGSVFRAGDCHVELTFQDDGGAFTIRRDLSRTGVQTELVSGVTSLTGPNADSEILRRLYPALADSTDSHAAVQVAVERALYLQQDRVADFVTAAGDDDRYDAISDLFGVGQIRQLESRLTSERRRWSATVTEKENRVASLTQRLQGLQDQCQALRQALEDSQEAGAHSRATDQWRDDVTRLLGAEWGHEDLSDAASFERVLSALEAFDADLRRSIADARALSGEWSELQGEPQPDVETLAAAAGEAERKLLEARELLVAARERAARERADLVARQERESELRTLLQLALSHLSDRCPVCRQTIDADEVGSRIGAVLAEEPAQLSDLPAADEVSRRTEELRAAEAEATTRQAALDEARHRLTQWERRRQSAIERLERLGMDPDGADGIGPQVDRLVENLQSLSGSARLLRSEGERAALGRAASGQAARLSEYESAARETAEELEAAEADLRQTQETRDHAGRIIESLRSVGVDLVNQDLRRISAVVQRIYASADPHPIFRTPRLAARMWHGKGRLDITLGTTTAGLEDLRDPARFLSSSQLNVLAVAIFLGLSLTSGGLSLRMAMLDDPLQSLDDVNLLGIIDVLRRVGQRRQLILSTHDERFAALLERKLRPISASHRTLAVHLSRWEVSGPAINVRELPSEERAVRVVA